MPPRPALGLAAAAALCATTYFALDGPGRAARLIGALADPRATNADFFQNWGAATDFAQRGGGGVIYAPLNRDYARFGPHLGDVYGPTERSPFTGQAGPSESTVLPVNAHPPFATLLVLPAGHATYSGATRGYAAMNLALLAVAAILLVSAGGPGRPPLGTRLALLAPSAAFAASSEPLSDQLTTGNWNCLLLALLVAGWRLAPRRPALAGAAVGVASLVKIYPALVILAFVPKGRRRGLVGFAVTLAAGTALTLAVFGPGDHLKYVREVLPRLKMQTAPTNVSIPACAGRLFDPAQPNVVPLVRSKLLLVAWVAAWGAAMLGPVTLRLARGDPADPAGLVAALVAASVVLSPVAYGHNLLLLAVPAYSALLSAVRRREALATVALALAGCVVWLGPTDLQALAGFGPNTTAGPLVSLTLFSAPTYAAVVVYALALRAALGGDSGCTVP